MSYRSAATKPRANELTAIQNREIFDAYPAGCESDEDKARWRLFRQQYERAARFEERAEFPLHIDFELNSTCQMRCAHCLHGQGVIKKREIAFETFQKVVDEAARYGLCSIKFNYINEPLLVADLPRFIAYARSRGVLNTYFATNGLLLTREVAGQLIDVRHSKIMVSLDAVTSETFLKMRRSTKFDAIIENIRGFLDLRRERGVDYPKLRVNFLRTRDNIHEAEAFLAQWAGVADAIGFQTQVGLPGVDDDLWRGDEVTIEDFRCAFPMKQLVIDSSGSILPCCTFGGKQLSLGDVNESTLKEAWDSSRMRELQQLHAQGRWRDNPVCRQCISGHAK